MRLRIGTVVLFAVFLATPLAAQSRRRAVNPQPRPLTAVEWLQASAIPFDTTEARTPLGDLEPLRNIVGNARIVALGEATHGTHEFFTMKHRMLQFLVEEMGFTVFAIEANLPEADRVEDYVLNGNGDPSVALAGMYFWTWNTDEVLDMILWMREYNLARGDRPPVHFRGFDDQFIDYALPQVEAYVQRIDPDLVAELRADYDCIRPYTINSPTRYGSLPQSRRAACAANVQSAFAAIESRRDHYTALSTRDEYEKILRYARVIVETEAVATYDGSAAGALVRDQFMAENVQWVADVEHPGEKVVLWAHNFHVSTDPTAMGSVLRKRFGSDMVIFGFDFDHGSFTAVGSLGSQSPDQPVNVGLATQTITAGPDTGWEKFFANANRPRFFIDVRNPSSADAKSYLAVSQRMWLIGAVWTGIYSIHRPPAPLPGRYDVIIYIETTTASRLRH